MLRNYLHYTFDINNNNNNCNNKNGKNNKELIHDLNPGFQIRFIIVFL